MSGSSHRNWISLSCGVLLCFVSGAAFAQPQPRAPQLPAPPPMRIVTHAEREQLNAARDPKTRVRTTIDLAADHLTHAEYYTAEKKFVQASEELGGYLGLIDNAVEFIGDLAHDKASTRDLYRHLDIALRAHIPRIAVMRRSTPAEYARNLKAVEEYARDTRADVLESFYGHTVLRGDPEYQKKTDKTKNQPDENKHP
jgi:hypothetical protein